MILLLVLILGCAPTCIRVVNWSASRELVLERANTLLGTKWTSSASEEGRANPSGALPAHTSMAQPLKSSQGSKRVDGDHQQRSEQGDTHATHRELLR